MRPMLVSLIGILLLVAACAPAPPAPTQVAVVADELLEFGGAVAGSLPVGVAERGYVFVSAAGDSVRITLDSDADVRLQLFAPDAALVAEGNQAQVSLPQTGAYRVVVSREDTMGEAFYSLSVSNLPTPTPSHTPLPPTVTPTATPTPTLTPTPIYAPLGTFLGELSGSQTITGEFTQAGETFVFLLPPAESRVLNVMLTPLDDGIDPALTLYDAQGQPLATDEEAGGADMPQLSAQLEVGAAYYVQARADGDGGAYQLVVDYGGGAAQQVTPAPTLAPPVVLIPTPAAGEGELSEYMPLTGRLARPGEFARYTLRAEAGEVITLGVYPAVGGALRPVVELFDEDGISITQSGTQGDGSALLPAVVIPTTGIYSAFVTGADDTAGDFVIAFGRGGAYAEQYRGLIAVNVPTPGSIARRGWRDVWALRLNAGDRLTATVVAADALLDPALELVAPDGSRIVYNDDLPGEPSAAFGDVTVSNAGIYLLRVTGENALTAGAYTLVWRYLAAAPTPTPLPASVVVMAVDGELGDGGAQRYAFQGSAGQRVRVDVMAAGALDPLAAILAPDGSTLIEVDDSEGGLNPRFEIELPAEGTYTLVVRGYGAGGGAFAARVVTLILN
jgi:hypothetical protein